MNWKKDDFIELDVSMKTEDGEEVFDSKKNNFIKNTTLSDNSVLHIIGKKDSNLDKVFENIISNLDVGVEKEIKLAPEEAFGLVDKSLIKKYLLSEIENETEKKLNVGDIVTNDESGLSGVVKYIENGRITIDFNEKYAGKTIIAKAKIVRKIEDINDKIQALADRLLNNDELIIDKSIKIDNTRIYDIKFDKESGLLKLFTNNEFMYYTIIYSMFKFELSFLLSTYIKEINKIEIIEDYDTKQVLIAEREYLK